MNKKPVVIGGIIFLFVIAMIVVIGNLTNSGKKTQQVNSENHSFGQILPTGSNGSTPGTHIRPNPSNTVSETQQTNSTTQWITYNGEGFSMQYPSQWTIQDKSLTGYKMLQFVPNVNYVDPVAPYVLIEVIESPTKSLADQEKLALPISPPVKQQFAGQPADVFDVVNPSVTFAGQSYGRMEAKTFFIQYGQRQFRIESRYSLENTRSGDASIVKSMLDSFIFH